MNPTLQLKSFKDLEQNSPPHTGVPNFICPKRRAQGHNFRGEDITTKTLCPTKRGFRIAAEQPAGLTSHFREGLAWDPWDPVSAKELEKAALVFASADRAVADVAHLGSLTGTPDHPRPPLAGEKQGWLMQIDLNSSNSLR